MKDGIQGITDIDVGVAIERFFGKPMVVQDARGMVLACALFEEIKVEINNNNNNNNNTAITQSQDGLGEEDNTPSDGVNSRSGTSAAALVIFAASSILMVAATLL